MKNLVNNFAAQDSATKSGLIFVAVFILPLAIAVLSKIASGATLHY